MEALQTPHLVGREEGAEATEVAEVVKVLMIIVLPGPLLLVEGRKKKDGFSSKIQIPEFGGKKGHSGNVTDAF